MSRLIDADRLYRGLCNWKYGSFSTEECVEFAILESVLDGIQRQPTIDAVPVVRCKDCKHWICHDRRCGYWNHGVKPLDWCCHGERKDEDAPTIDAIPVVHGHWEVEDGRVCCSVCGEQSLEYDYCPYCEAKMDETDSSTNG